jgi:acetyl esterase
VSLPPRSVLALALLLGAACQPRTTPLPQPTSRAAYAIAGDDTLHVIRFAPPRDSAATARPAVLFVPGHSWTSAVPDSVYSSAAAFAEAGFESLVLEYRVAGDIHTPLESLADLCAALRWTRLTADSLGIDSSRIAIYGEAAGGHLAAATATVGCPAMLGERGADALLLTSPLVDVADDSLLRSLLGDRAEPSDVSPLLHGRVVMPPTVLVQGSLDVRAGVPGAQQFCLLVVSTRQQCDLRIYDGLGHLLAPPSR